MFRSFRSKCGIPILLSQSSSVVHILTTYSCLLLSVRFECDMTKISE
ncbi:hypothetical protein T06_5027 [Trichinella sp. T6]|nr:hypothetical protein T06_16241 [Trichinella sp. T6]KRX82331.1 hypothetical protein T06_5027 [Trichinella sp. T6]